MKRFLLMIQSLAVLTAAQTLSAKSVAYLHGDVAEDGTIPSGAAAAYDQMLLTDAGNTGCSQFKAMVEAEGYSISQHYDQTTLLDAAFLAPLDVVVFGLHQKVWTAPEKAALDDWIRAGGGILMYSDSAAGGKYNVVGIKNPTGQTAVNNILSAYGMEVAVDQGGGVRSYTSSPHSPNPIVWDQPVFEGEGVSPVAIDPSGNAQALVPLDEAHKVSGSALSIDTRGIAISNPEWAVIAHCTVGRGNIVAIFDRQPMWNNGPGSDINEEDNKEVLRRIVRFLARDYGNSSEWLALTCDGLELTHRRWSTERNSLITVQHSTNLVTDVWETHSNWVESVSVAPESAETELATVRLLPDATNPTRYARIAILPATNAPPPASTAVAINCGGSAFTGSDGTAYLADSFYTGGHTDAFPGNAVANTDDDLLYNYARSGHSAYNIPVDNGTYTVHLKFAETYFSQANKRIFDVFIEGSLVLENLDLFATAPGQWVAYDRTFTATVSDGTLNIGFTASTNNALLNAIVVLRE
ncbi:malectin domain-containing carbohydrate-binding protein [Pontiella desulfatans]|nr:malectin domain-containing carbohydrate-binding protein [Pontiella desulfatans]